MSLEPVTQREVSHKEKDRWGILTHMYGAWKDGADEPVCRAAVETQIQTGSLWMHCGEAEGGTT